MKSNIVKMIKNSILNGLKNNNFNWATAEPGDPGASLFTSSQDKRTAIVTALRIMATWKAQAQHDPSKLPSSLNELERVLDIYLAEMSGMEAATFMNMKLRPRSNEDLWNETQAAINTLKKYGEDSKAYVIERTMNLKRKQ